jgi:hypothetical protein
MRTDRSAKLLLILIALGLWVNALAPLFRSTTVRASSSTHCTGTLKANAWGGEKATIGGYDVDVNCSE